MAYMTYYQRVFEEMRQQERQHQERLREQLFTMKVAEEKPKPKTPSSYSKAYWATRRRKERECKT